MHGKAMMRKNRSLPRISKARGDDRAGDGRRLQESEQITGWFTMIEENLGVPFETTVLGVPSKASIWGPAGAFGRGIAREAA